MNRMKWVEDAVLAVINPKMYSVQADVDSHGIRVDVLSNVARQRVGHVRLTAETMKSNYDEWAISLKAQARKVARDHAGADGLRNEATNDDLTFEALRQANADRVSSFGHGGLESWDAPRWFMATAGELGELGNLLKKVERGDMTLEEAIEDVGHEIADVAIYLDLLAQRLGLHLEPCIRRKFNLTSIRIRSDVRL